MGSLTSLRQASRLLLLKSLAKLFRALILTVARLTSHQKPNPDLIEYIPATPTTTKTNKKDTPNPTHKIKTHIYYPPPSTNPTPPSPVLITACGSGFIAPGLGLDDPYCRLIATQTSHTVIDVRYRLAPEDPFPCALEDIASVVSWVLAQPERFDPARISIGGFSAGANLAVSVAVNYFPPKTFWALLAFYPVLDAARDPGAKEAVAGTGRPALGGMGSVPAVVMRFMRDCYVAGEDGGEGSAESVGGGEGCLLKDPRVSPAYAEVGRFPARCFFVTCEFDCLARETEELAGRIQGGGDGEEGRKVVVHRVKGCGHAFDKTVKVGSERERVRDEVYGMVVDMLRGD
ncbi:Alpha/Beta hydrolase protein [Aspergillus aurantiobrunneus]